MTWKELQRIVSRTEPELGLGSVRKVTHDGFIVVEFTKSGEVRRYSARNAPLHRFRLRIGQKAFVQGGEMIEVLSSEVDEIRDLVKYNSTAGQAYWEYELEDRVHDQGALEHFFSGHLSRHQSYDLRREARKIRRSSEKSGIQGLIGPRVTPLPHQLFIAAEVSRRMMPRVLLADEVGLGKTIEAGLIFSSLRALGRADKVLILVPESLIHQWVAEMFRRFNQIFSVIDEERIEAELASQGMSAFSMNQHVILSMELIQNHSKIKNELMAQSWDLTIIDEAHHLRWDEEQPEPKWLLAREIAAISRGLLLLTATPSQFGLATQFGLLHLVDPERFGDFDVFAREQIKHREVAALAQYIASNGVDDQVRTAISDYFGDDAALIEKLDQIDGDQLLRALIDRHGTGRVLFRNRRERLRGFPNRVLNSVPLLPNDRVRQRLTALGDLDDEMLVMDLATGRWNRRLKALPLQDNPKFEWLVGFLQSQPGQKVLVLCGSVEGVIELKGGLESHGIAAAVFHENLSVIERDMQAAAFADPQGSNVLICSEIGGEGRNFQFSNQLVFIDLPKHPDLVEQRIGRLDRIGQRRDVLIHVPWIQDTPEETLFRWYHEGLDAFQSSWNGAAVIIEEFLDDIFETLNAFLPQNNLFKRRHELLEQLIAASRQFVEQVQEENRKSVDVLIDLNSFSEDKGVALQENIEDIDDDTSVEFFMRSFFDYFGVDYEDFDDRGTIVIHPENMKFIDKIPGVHDTETTLMTFDRNMALKREDMIFLSRDHPMVEECLALLLERNEGVASLCKWEHSPYGPGALIEFSIVLEASGPKQWELSRFLASETKELCYTHDGKRVKERRHKRDDSLLSDIPEHEYKPQLAHLPGILDPIIAKCLDKAARWAEEKISLAVAKAQSQLGEDLDRLRELQIVNPLVSNEEVVLFEKRILETTEHLGRAQARIDAIRLIFTR